MIGGGHGPAHGLYEALHTRELQHQLNSASNLNPVFGGVESEDSPDLLAEHIAARVREALAAAKPEERVALANSILQPLSADGILPGPQQLLSLAPVDALDTPPQPRPRTSLRRPALLTNGRDDPNLAHELSAEMGSADRVDLLCAFIRWTGLRLLEPALENLHDRGVRLRVITSTYMGATERRAIDQLVEKYGAEVRINYETHATRLHAKAWMFHRATGFDTAYVGSSNLSAPAMLDGLEWNVKLSAVGTPELLQKFNLTFDSYWQQPAFQPYNPAFDGDRLDAALLRNGGRQTARPDGATGLEIQPYLHQQEMLESLEAERTVHNRHRNLLVAATGTGKTVIAALDYKRLCDAAGRDLSLLFVAHRQEILKQSLQTYRDVMQRGAFGELLVGSHKPTQWTQVFASVQSLASLPPEQLVARNFDVVVIDEFHHAQAPTYQRLLERLEPRELLGLTATPERGDGVNVADQFFDGRVAGELRLWDALDADLLVPFHYFGIADNVDLRRVEWKRGNYDTTQLDALYTGNDARAAKIITELRDKVTSTQDMRALGFCVSVEHARYMAEVFNRAGIASRAVTGDTREEDREDALRQLRERTLSCLFTVDLFNEGLDLPEIDTILLLRPTQSATVFLQQLGRGLRRAEGKAVLTVLDFIGQHRREFRFENKFRALTGLNRKALEGAVQEGFPFLPSGSQIVLDRVAQQTVLTNIRTQLRMNRQQLVSEIRSHGEALLENYLRESGRELSEVYRKTGDSWTSLVREAGLADVVSVPDVVVSPSMSHGVSEETLLRRMTALLCVDDPERAEAYAALAAPGGAGYDELSPREQRLARMLFFAIWPNGGGHASYDDGLEVLRSYPEVATEIRQLAALGVQNSRYAPRGLGMGLQQVPLYSHATYRREEVLAAMGYFDLGGRTTHREGVAWCQEVQTDVFFVTLEKDAKERAASIMYKDYAMSPEVFHWESQNTTSPESVVGRRYLGHRSAGTRVLLFTRAREKDENGMTMPYTCLGQMDYMAHTGSRPIAITWKLHRAMPADVYVEASAVAR